MKKSISYVVIFTICTIICGCSSSNVGSSNAELKAQLIKEIDREYSNPDAHYRLGRIYQSEGLWPKAEHEFDLALSFDPVHRGAQAGKVRVLFDSGKHEKSSILLEEYTKQASQSAAASLDLGMTLEEQRFADAAFQCYMRALSLAPDSYKVHKQLGYYYLKKGDTEKTIDFLSRSFQLNPNQPEVAGQLGKLGVAVRIPNKHSDPQP